MLTSMHLTVADVNRTAVWWTAPLKGRHRYLYASSECHSVRVSEGVRAVMVESFEDQFSLKFPAVFLHFWNANSWIIRIVV
uniref:Uncharacterized protein n=1 Tax=Anguilla anguilla TaxID=7936 RepID=A0A0E9PDK1_ANGAN